MSIPGLKDWRTTGPAIALAASLFVTHYPNLFPEHALWAQWVKAIITFVVGPGSVIIWGVNSASTAKVKQKAEERLEPIEQALGMEKPSPVGPPPPAKPE